MSGPEDADINNPLSPYKAEYWKRQQVVLGNGGAEAIFASRNLKKKIMKKIFLPILFSMFFCNLLKAQTAKWFAGIATGYPVGGPSASLKSDMKDQGFDQTSAFNILGSGEYPKAAYIPPLLIMAGRQISEFGSLSWLPARLPVRKWKDTTVTTHSMCILVFCRLHWAINLRFVTAMRNWVLVPLCLYSNIILTITFSLRFPRFLRPDPEDRL